MKKLRVLFCLLISLQGAHAMLEPMLDDITENRKHVRALWMELEHQIELAGEQMTIHETILDDNAKSMFRWESVKFSVAVPIIGVREGKQYKHQGQVVVNSKSDVWVRYLFFNKEVSLKSLLVKEGFVRRDQFFLFKTGFNPTGEPKSWDSQKNLLMHQDIFRTRIRGMYPLTVVGNGETKTYREVSFNLKRPENPASLVEIKWGSESSSGIIAWRFLDSSEVAKVGTLPKSMEFDFPGRGEVKSTVKAIKVLADKELEDARNAFRNPSKVSLANQEIEHLRFLLEYR